MAGLDVPLDPHQQDSGGPSITIQRPQSTPPISGRRPNTANRQLYGPDITTTSRVPSRNHSRNGTRSIPRSPVMGGDADRLYTSGLRRIRQQIPSHGAQGFIPMMSSPTASLTPTRANSFSLPPSTSTLGSCEDLDRFPSESLHSFSFAHQSEDLIHSRQNILKRSIEFMRDKLGWGAQSPLIADAHARVHGDNEMETIIELLRKADIVSAERTPMITGPITGPAHFEGNPFEQSFAGPPSRSTTPNIEPLSDVPMLSSSPVDEGPWAPLKESDKLAAPSLSLNDRPSLKRTFTDTSTLALQSKLYDAIAQPYFDQLAKTPPSSIGQRNVIRKASVHGQSNRYAPPSQAIFTTLAHEPWTILAANDLACLVFGLSQSDVRNIGIMEVVREERREWLANKLNSGENTSTSFPYPHSHHGSPVPVGNQNRRSKSDAFFMGAGISEEDVHLHHGHGSYRGVVLCGDVVPIQKRNGSTGAASLWVKEKRGGLIWVVEEINEDVGFLHLDQESATNPIVWKAEGSLKNIFGTANLSGTELLALMPTIPRLADGGVDFSTTGAIHQFTVKGRGGAMIPCGVEPVGKEIVPSVRVSSFPHIAGIIVLSASTLKISSTNAVFSSALFGHVNPIGVHINDIIPGFERILSYLLQEEHVNLQDGLVVPEHSFRKANAILAIREGKDDGFSIISRPGGLVALHRDGSKVFVDLQMRVVMSESRNSEVFTDAPDKSELVYALWVTYSRHLHVASCAHASQQPAMWIPETPPQGPVSGPSEVNLSPKSESSTMSAASDPAMSIPQQTSKHPTPPSSDDEHSFPILRTTKPPMPRISTAPAAMSKRQKTIQDFAIIEDMGEGAYGQVKLARYKRNASKRVVLKYVTKKRILVDTWTRDRRLGTVPLEIHVLDYLRRDGLQHPNIVEMTDFFEDDINYYIEMVPHGLPGMDLFDYIELKVNMDEEECRSIFVQVARALHHLHTRAGVCHRDIKDENVILDGQGNIKLIDFGSATYVKNGPFSVFVGTIDYAAPEVLRGKTYRGKEQDCWALGILLYTIIGKENPFYNVDEIMDGELRVPFGMSEISLDLVKYILDRNVETRPTIEKILEHQWFDGLPSPEEAMNIYPPIEASVAKHD